MKLSKFLTLLVFMLSLLISVPAGLVHAEMARYNVDPDHSTVGFSVTHMTVSKTTGRFMDFTGFIDIDPDTVTVKSLEANIKTASVSTNHKKRDTHLKGPDFFDVKKYPTMTFKMKSYKKTGDVYTVLGDLTLRGITKEITLVGNLNGVSKDPWGSTRAGFSASGKINRKDFGMVWNKVLDNGGLVVGDDVMITLDIEGIKAK
ncbi:MAG: polyisoprenoid-binding protein [Nitrospirae bacterium]|nr:polyisoprenoid-binding protein [Nitrospirota bacterium]